MGQFIYTNESSLTLAATIQTLLATSVVKTFKPGPTIGPGTKKATLVAAENAYDGYAAKTVTAWQAPYLSSGGGAAISSGYLQWDYGPVGTPPVTEQVAGFWLEDAAGSVIVVGLFDDPVDMEELGDSLPLTITLSYGRAA